MERLKGWLIKIAAGERGQDMVEYALITVLVSVVIVLAVMTLLNQAFADWATDLATCITGPASACDAIF